MSSPAVPDPHPAIGLAADGCASCGPAGPFTLSRRLPGPPSLAAVVAALGDRVLGLAELQRIYQALPRGTRDDFAARALDALAIALEPVGDLDALPASGPLLVVANHPFGALDGLALAALLRGRRRDVRVLGNDLLSEVPELRGTLIAVDVFRTGRARVAANVHALRSALEWLSGGGCLMACPAGQVAYRRGPSGVARDERWHPHVAALAAKSGASVAPVLIAGANSALFRSAGLVHPLARTALLARELVARRGSTVRVVVGDVIGPAALAHVPAVDRAAYLEARTFLLADRLPQRREPSRLLPRLSRLAAPARALRSWSRPGVRAPLAAPVDTRELHDDVVRLPASALVASAGDLRVYCADAGDLPHVLPEIGRLRELCFRAAGEGTGRAEDLDAFDERYAHVFAWDVTHRRIAGAYRIGASDRVADADGCGLYTRSLFRFDRRLLDAIGPALELGRSFVAPEYQKAFAPLLLLWKGIGQLVAREPRYRHVFGACSISSRYDRRSRALLVEFLSHAVAHPAARLVTAKRPFALDRGDHALIHGTRLSDLDSVDAVIRAIEPGGEGVPVLLRHYLALNARVLGTSVDPAFGDALDALMVADLRSAPAAMVARLLGKDGARRFAAGHGTAA